LSEYDLQDKMGVLKILRDLPDINKYYEKLEIKK
jgi:hypothetical protein